MMQRLLKRLFSLRLEEFIAILFFVPMVYLTTKAYFYFLALDKVPRRILGDMHRIWITVGVFLIFLVIIKLKPQWRFIRDWLPFGFCIAIYTNLHDTVHFANQSDVQHWLIKIDQWLFGVQPCVWAEQFIHPTLTDIFIAAYANYFVLNICVAVVLYFQKRYQEFRYTLVTTIICYYMGYFLFIIFPAAPPRIVLKPFFTVSLHGHILEPIKHAIEVSAQDSRGAFPSLHCAVSFVSMFFGWRYLRWMFWVMVPMVIMLVISTIYLRHHYVIDLIAGLALAFFAFWIGPKIEDWWAHLQSRYFPPTPSISS
ncbi:MAG: phosphatase PAP2 family protein [candidate division KSB1 bacterium]|nr:phosphatase PAP2 family protein [candidate division KSB1 bacterium]MDZ7319612.1 phosphatase PAP2 family protein [candidate division KSB1 bacterium]MDZ7342613.1 phosphatase PAP2 family protein [candidate division KSB1 bacterium]